ERAQSVPDFPTRQVRAGRVGEIAENGVVATDQVVAALAGLCVSELAPLPLADGVPRKYNLPALHQPLAQRLVMIFAVGRMSRRHENRGMLFGSAPLAFIRHVEQSTHINSRNAFEDHLLNLKAVH